MRTLDIVTSAKNESGNIVELYTRIKSALENEPYKWKLIISDNNSIDETWDEIVKLAQSVPNVHGLRMTRDFGFEASILAGLEKSQADVVLMMTSDLQDPPEAIPQFLKKYEEGYDHVFQIVTDRRDISIIRKFNSKLFYYFGSIFSDGLIVRHSSVFRLITKQMTSDLIRLQERNRFVRALIPWLGYKQTGIPIARHNRTNGESKANSKVAIKYAVKGLLSNSYALLDLVGLLGILTFTVSFLAIIVCSVIWLFVGVPFAGYGLLLGAVIMGFGLVFLCLGIMAQYLSLIYEEVKQRPNYLIREEIGM